MTVFRDLGSLLQWRGRLQGSLAFVPTMGNLHAGHLSLVRLAQARAEEVLVSIYVNPLQFGPEEDFASYPRTLDADLRLLDEIGCQHVFVPTDTLLYPQGLAQQTLVQPPAHLSKVLCGAHRPGHFTGVATVVLKLLHLIEPQILILGEKDYQQYRIIQQMLSDLHCKVQLLLAPTQREADGLALSSRNVRLRPEERRIAPSLAAALAELAQLDPHSAPGPAALALEERLTQAGLQVDYLELRDSETLQLLPRPQAGARWFGAARLGSVRLIDNRVIP